MTLNPMLGSSFPLTLRCPSCSRMEQYTSTDLSGKQMDFIHAIMSYTYTKIRLLVDSMRLGNSLFLLSSQITGYCLALGVWAGQAIERAEIFGMSIPLPKNYDFGGIVREVVPRYTHHFERWFDWFLHTVQLEVAYKDDPINAPKYTHSCNRYFRPCALIPFCDATDDEQHTILTEMYEDQWNPLHEDKGGD